MACQGLAILAFLRGCTDTMSPWGKCMVLAGLLYVQGLLYMLYVQSKETLVANVTHYLKVSFAKIRVFTCLGLLLGGGG